MAFFLFRVIRNTPKKAMRHLKTGDRRGRGEMRPGNHEEGYSRAVGKEG